MKKNLDITVQETKGASAQVSKDYKPQNDLGNIQKDQELNTGELEKTSSEDLMKSNWTELVPTFDEMGLKFDLLKGIYAFGFENPSKIQQLCIKPMISGKDVICQAQAGSGKTATFVISALQLIDEKNDSTQCMLLSPTKELASQSMKTFVGIGEQHLNVKSHLFIGGTSIKKDIQVLKDGVHVVSGTPGRVMNMIEKNYIKTSELKVLIIDEADQMLSRDFLNDIKKVVKFIPPECKIWLISATMPKEIVELTSHFMTDPVKILVAKEDLPIKAVNQYYVTLKKEWKLETLIDLYKGININQAMIFCNSKKTVDYLSEELKKKGHMVSAIHSDMETQERMDIMEKFYSGQTRVLIATDLLAKGIDVYKCNLVINYDLPFGSNSKEFYLHRVGRCGRLGRKGIAINFVLPDEKEELEEIQKFYNVTIEKLTDLNNL